MAEVVEPVGESGTHDHPSALLTFLLADIRGYTRYSAEQGDRAAARVSEHFLALCREVVSAHGGDVFGSAGDQALAAFSSAHAALHAALALQVRLAEEQAAFPELPLTVGIGLDTGEGIKIGNDYRGNAINLAARLCSLAGSGEIFASETVITVARRVEGISVIDRGEVMLKGLTSTVRVVQIVAVGALPAKLPLLQPIVVTHPNNLPDEPTPFIGRSGELIQMTALLGEPGVRLVTLTGPGGTGKTRLAVQVGTTVLHDYRNGVFFTSLASLTDPALVASAIAEVLDVKEAAERSLLDSLVHYLKEKHLLLVLDNFEHLLESASVVAALLDHCRELHILVTSRIPLHLAREHEYAVPPLSLPDLANLPAVATLSQYESVALFINRARAVKADFEVTNATAPAVAEICSRLDGLPLAIELAAARTRLFPPQALLQRLDHRLTLLTGGARDRPTRQQTLRNTIDWSYSLLSPDEQTLFGRMSVFAGGCTLAAVEAVNGLDEDIVDRVTSLLEQSLLREMAGDQPRFTMLETIREYALELLEAHDGAEEVRERHAAHYLALAEDAEPELTGPQQVEWMNRLETEHDNLRAALRWMLAEQREEEGLRLAGALWRFWWTHGHLSEGRRWLERVLVVGRGGFTVVRAKALNGVGFLAFFQGDHERATNLHDQSLALRRELGDASGIAASLNNLGNIAITQGDFDRATTLYQESLDMTRKLGDTSRIAGTLGNLAGVAESQGKYERATSLTNQSLTLFRKLGDTWGIASSLSRLGEVACGQREYARAIILHDESLAMQRALGDTAGIASSLHNLGTVAFGQGDYDRATTRYRESLELTRDLGYNSLAVESVEWLANVSVVRHKPERATRLWGATDAWREANRVPRWPVDREQHEWMVDEARQQLDDATWTTAWEKGRTMSFEQAISYALEETV